VAAVTDRYVRRTYFPIAAQLSLTSYRIRNQRESDGGASHRLRTPNGSHVDCEIWHAFCLRLEKMCPACFFHDVGIDILARSSNVSIRGKRKGEKSENAAIRDLSIRDIVTANSSGSCEARWGDKISERS